MTEARRAFGDGKAYTYVLEGASAGVFNAANAGDAWSVRNAAAVFYGHAMALAALIDQSQGREPAPWTAPEQPDDYPPRPLD